MDAVKRKLLPQHTLGIYAIANSTLSLGGVNTFRANRAHVSGGGIWLDHSNLTLSGFNHFVGCAASYEGGAIYSYAATASLTGDNTFEYNSATTGGGLHARDQTCLLYTSPSPRD